VEHQLEPSHGTAGVLAPQATALHAGTRILTSYPSAWFMLLGDRGKGVRRSADLAVGSSLLDLR
jgi:hypothetical protein